MLEFDMLSNGTYREFRWAAVQEANSLLKSRMHVSFSMVRGVRNTGQLSKFDGTVDESAQSRASHTRSLGRFTQGRSVQDCFHRSQIAQKMVPLLFIKERVIKGRKPVCRLLSLLLRNL